MWGRREKERDKVVWLGRNNSEAMNGAKGAAASSSYDTPPPSFLPEEVGEWFNQIEVLDLDGVDP
jgi:hypothetical protein